MDNPPLDPLTLFQWQVLNVSFTSRKTDVGFHAWVAQAPEQIDA
jgi:hypothetical protein